MKTKASFNFWVPKRRESRAKIRCAAGNRFSLLNKVDFGNSLSVTSFAHLGARASDDLFWLVKRRFGVGVAGRCFFKMFAWRNGQGMAMF